MDRLQEKQRLLVKLGALFGPLQQIIQNPDQYDEQERARAVAEYRHGSQMLHSSVEAFGKGEQGCDYQVQVVQFWQAINGINTGLINGSKEIEESVPEAFDRALGAIDAIPISSSSVILEAGTPFTTYCKLRALCEIDALSDLTWIDPYFSASIFHRYISAVRDGVKVTVVTAEPCKSPSKRDKLRWQELLDVSRLYADERGAENYRLIVHSGTLHDRWIVFDRKRIYALGGSAKDAGDRQYFTISHVEGSAENLATIQAHIDDGVEYFGPSTPTHRDEAY